MQRDSISSPGLTFTESAFTLVEVIVAVGLLAVTVLAVVAVQGVIGRSVHDASGYERAAQLVDAVTIELSRLRDRPAAIGQPARLDALAAIIPASESPDALRLVASRDGTRVSFESEADSPATCILPSERYFLIEVRQQPAPLAYVAEAGYLAVNLRVKWPYQVPTGPDPSLATAVEPSLASTAIFHSALTP